MMHRYNYRSPHSAGRFSRPVVDNSGLNCSKHLLPSGRVEMS